MSELTQLEKEYEEKYGSLPDRQEDLLELIRTRYKLNDEKLSTMINQIASLEWKEVSLTFNLIPKPSPRPRSTSNGHFYVKGANQHRKTMRRLVTINEIAYTLTKVSINIYEPIPVSSMTGHEIYLAQLGLIRPIGGGDWDNLAKTYCDMMQGFLICNDNIIFKGSVEKFYSLKPKIEINVMYQVGFDCKFNERKMKKSKAYQNLKPLIESYHYA